MTQTKKMIQRLPSRDFLNRRPHAQKTDRFHKTKKLGHSLLLAASGRDSQSVTEAIQLLGCFLSPKFHLLYRFTFQKFLLCFLQNAFELSIGFFGDFEFETAVSSQAWSL